MAGARFCFVTLMGCCTLAQAADPLPAGCDAAAGVVKATAAAVVAVFPPPQLELRTPVAPRVFASGGRQFLFYELHLHNFSDDVLPLRGIDVLDDRSAVLATLDAPQLRERVRFYGIDDGDESLRLGPGRSAVAMLCLAFDTPAAVPRALHHRIRQGQVVVEGPAVVIDTTPAIVLGRPLKGSDWVPDNGPSIDSHHRKGVMVVGGQMQNARRYAIDWKRYRKGESYSGGPRQASNHYAYGADVLAVADARVVAASDAMPDNIPRTRDGFTPAISMTMANLAGNFVVLALPDGQYAQYAHMRPGSVKVRTGETVRRGQLIGQVGISGDARVPHLHFQVSDNPDFLAGEGMPFVQDSFRRQNPNGSWEPRAKQLPLGNAVIDFGD